MSIFERVVGFLRGDETAGAADKYDKVPLPLKSPKEEMDGKKVKNEIRMVFNEINSLLKTSLMFTRISYRSN